MYRDSIGGAPSHHHACSQWHRGRLVHNRREGLYVLPFISEVVVIRQELNPCPTIVFFENWAVVKRGRFVNRYGGVLPNKRTNGGWLFGFIKAQKSDATSRCLCKDGFMRMISGEFIIENGLSFCLFIIKKGDSWIAPTVSFKLLRLPRRYAPRNDRWERTSGS